MGNTRYKTPLYEKELGKLEKEDGGLLGPVLASGLSKLVPGHLFFKNTFENILFDKNFLEIFDLRKMKEFIIEIS